MAHAYEYKNEDFFSYVSRAPGFSVLHACAQSAYYEALSLAAFPNCQVDAPGSLYADCLCTNNAAPLSSTIGDGVSSYGCSAQRESSTERESALSVFDGFCSNAAKAVGTVDGGATRTGADATATARPGDAAAMATNTGAASSDTGSNSSSSSNIGLVGLVGLLGLLAIPLTIGMLWYAKRKGRWGFHAPQNDGDRNGAFHGTSAGNGIGAGNAEKRSELGFDPAMRSPNNASINRELEYGRHELSTVNR